MKHPPNAVPMSPAAADALIKGLEACGVPQSDPACVGCLSKARELARLRKQLARVTGERDRLRELLGGKGSD